MWNVQKDTTVYGQIFLKKVSHRKLGLIWYKLKSLVSHWVWRGFQTNRMKPHEQKTYIPKKFEYFPKSVSQRISKFNKKKKQTKELVSSNIKFTVIQYKVKYKPKGTESFQTEHMVT